MKDSPRRSARSGPGIALLGCGAWGLNHLRAWMQLGRLRIACDPDPARLALVRARYPDLETCESPQRAIERDDVAAVVIATPASTHAALTLLALSRDMDVLVEKPLATSLADADTVAHMASRNGSVVMVNHLLQYHPAAVQLQHLVAEGALGSLLYLHSERLSLGRARSEVDALWSLAPHDVDQILRLLGRMPVEVACRGGAYLRDDVADTAFVSLGFTGGTGAHVFASWLYPVKQHRFVAVGDRRMAVFDDTAPWDRKLVLFPHRIEWGDGGTATLGKAEGVPVPLEGEEPLRAACQHFLTCIDTRRPPDTDIGSARRVLQVLDACSRSLASGGVPFALEGSPWQASWGSSPGQTSPAEAVG
jgi:UDP-2-acetamido-3-amino-2,3-dideoxy-glucuronate N-acetyltransferase